MKRFPLLLEAVEHARDEVPDVQLRIVGEGPVRGDLEAWITEHGAGDWATVLGHLPRGQLRDEYRRAWLVASASLAEGWGLSLTEGAACGTPAVATDIRGHRCSVVDGRTGVLVAPAELGPAIAALVRDPAQRDRLATAALARARTLTWDQSALGVLGVFRRVVRMSHGRATVPQ